MMVSCMFWKLKCISDKVFSLSWSSRHNLETNTVYCNSTYVQKFPGHIPTCQNMCLSSGGFTELPNAITTRTCLIQLSADNNYIRHIPSLANMGFLEALSVSHNDLTALDDGLCSATALKRIDLSLNKINYISPAICQLQHLQQLHLDHNKLTNLLHEFGSLVNLKRLNLDGNRLSQFPEAITKLYQLTYLLIHCNRLESLPDNMVQMTALKKLSVFGNRICKLPVNMGCLTALEMLNVGANELEYLPPSLVKIPELDILCSNNQLPKYFKLGPNKLQGLLHYMAKGHGCTEHSWEPAVDGTE